MTDSNLLSLQKHMKTVKSQVRYVLENYPNARNRDDYLIYQILSIFYNLHIPWDEWKKLFKHSGIFETIRRNRQLIQAKGDFLPTDESVLLKRKMKQKAMAILTSKGGQMLE